MVIRGLEGTITQPYSSKVRIWLAFSLAGSQFSLRYMYSIMQYLHFTIVFIQNHAAGSIVKHTLTSDRGGCAQDLNSGKTENSTCPQKKRGQVLFFSCKNPAEIKPEGISCKNPAEIKPGGISCKNPAEIKSEGNPAGIREDQSDTGMPPRSFQYASKASHSGLTQESALSR